MLYFLIYIAQLETVANGHSVALSVQDTCTCMWAMLSSFIHLIRVFLAYSAQQKYLLMRGAPSATPAI